MNLRQDRSPNETDIRALYDALLEAYGPQNWWPGDGPFEVIVGAILTQNTSWTNVEKALEALKSAGLWSIGALHETPLDRLAGTIRSSGYYNQKARKLKTFAELVEAEYAGNLARFLALPLVDLRPELLAVWGIGEETADDIVLYAAGHASFVIDGYTRRIVDRLGWRVDGEAYGDYQALFSDRLPADARLFNEYHALIVRHAADVCRPTPVCEGCVLLATCPTGVERIRR
ncbi:MAG: endonuclease [Chloroflexi bacterium]|nr:endonuclease [Chloroflexota bacterium]